jgi:hypothetical protein
MRDHSVIRIQRNHNGTDEIKKKSKIYVPQEKEQSSRFYINNSYEFEIVRNNFYVYWIKKKKHAQQVIVQMLQSLAAPFQNDIKHTIKKKKKFTI